MSTSNAGMDSFREIRDNLRTIVSQLSEKCIQQCAHLIADDEMLKLIRKDIRDSLKQKVDVMAKAMPQIQSSLSRKKMKVVFVGRTSSGKSTLINAILGRKILPGDPGHTTNCFVQLSGGDHEEARLTCDGKQIGIDDIEKISNAVESGDYGNNTVLHLEYPKHKCDILKHELLILDTPGLDNEENLDNWLFEGCSDSDVIVLVVDSTSTIGNTEMKFVETLRTSFSTFTNVFVVFNKWDLVIGDVRSNKQTVDRIRKQHVDKATKFVTNVLHTVPGSKLFFLSSRNVLSDKSAPCPSWNEFAAFEKVLMQTVSISAMQRKIEHHFHQLVGRNNEFAKMVRSMLEKAITEKEMIDKLANQWKSLLHDLRGIISDMQKEISEQVEGKLQQFQKPWYNILKDRMVNFSWKDGVSLEEGENARGNVIYSLFLTFWRDNKNLISGDLNKRVQEAFQVILLQTRLKLVEAASRKRLCLCAALDLSKLKNNPGPCTETGPCPSFLRAIEDSSLLRNAGACLESRYVNGFEEELQNEWQNHVTSLPSTNGEAESTQSVLRSLLSLILLRAGIPGIIDAALKLSDTSEHRYLLKEFEYDFLRGYWHKFLKKTSDIVVQDAMTELSRCLEGFVEKELVQVWEKHSNELNRLDIECRTIAENCVEVDRTLHGFRSKYSC